MQAEQPRQLGDRVRVVVDAQVQGQVEAAAVARAGTPHSHGGRLAASPVAAGLVASLERRQQPQPEALLPGAGSAMPGSDHRLHHLGSSQDVALHRNPLSGMAARPVEAAVAGEGGRAPGRVDHAKLAVGPSGIGAGEAGHRYLGAGPGGE